MDEQSITIEHQIILSEQFIKDIMVTMVESGYDSLFYWATLTHIERDSESYPHTIALLEDDEEYETQEEADNPTVHTLTRDMVAPAIEKIINKRLVGSELMHYLMRAVMDGDAGDVDATLADCILQVALLGEVVYG